MQGTLWGHKRQTGKNIDNVPSTAIASRIVMYTVLSITPSKKMQLPRSAGSSVAALKMSSEDPPDLANCIKNQRSLTLKSSHAPNS
jgi:hypothetical protein